MNRLINIRMLAVALIVLVSLIALFRIFQRPAQAERLSEFGKYQGYSQSIYDGNTRRSDYLRLSDGTRLAYDLILPTKGGVVADEPLPVLFKYTPYDRVWTVIDRNGNNNLAAMGIPWYYDVGIRFRAWVVPNGRGKLWDALFRTKWLEEMVNSGYAVVVVDRPGTGASFGEFNGDPEIVAGEADEILNWIAAQPWSDGNIGMFGDSIQAQIQFRAASAGNPHLKEILPATTWMDNYSAVMFPGGIPNKGFANFYVQVNELFELIHFTKIALQ